MTISNASPQSEHGADKVLLHALRKCDPDVVGDATLHDIEVVLNNIEPESLDDRLLSGLDMFYKSVTRRLLSHPEEDADLQAFDRHMAKQLSYRFQAQLANSTRSYQVRWDLMKELVADQRLVFQEAKGSTSIQALMRKKHMFDVLDIVARHYDRGMYQRDIGIQLDIAKSTVSTIITRLVESRLVKKSTAGKENCIVATVEGQRIWEMTRSRKKISAASARSRVRSRYKKHAESKDRMQHNQQIAG